MKPECESKCKLLRVAMQLLSESSYGSVSVDDICKKAEVKKGSFYYFFPSKSDLTVAAMETDWQAKQADLDRVFSPQKASVERIEAYCERAWQEQSTRKESGGKVLGCPMITLGAELSTQDEKIRQKTEEIVNRYIRYFESAVRDAISEGLVESDDPRAVAEDLFSYFQGVMLQAKVRNDAAPLKNLKEGMLRLLGASEAVVAA
jgi:TetR/AcrR family transcriptional regulator, transcriptional repressor for nem operon